MRCQVITHHHYTKAHSPWPLLRHDTADGLGTLEKLTPTALSSDPGSDSLIIAADKVRVSVPIWRLLCPQQAPPCSQVKKHPLTYPTKPVPNLQSSHLPSSCFYNLRPAYWCQSTYHVTFSNYYSFMTQIKQLCYCKKYLM